MRPTTTKREDAMNYEIKKAANGKYEIIDLLNGESSGPRYRTFEYAQKIATQMQADDEKSDAYEKAHK